MQLEPGKILVIALARSGYHAVCHWLCKKFPGTVVFMNNCNHLLQWRNCDTYSNGHSLKRSRMYSFENFDLRGFKELGIQHQFTDIIIVNRDPYNWIASSMSKGGKLAVLDKSVPTGKVFQYSKYTCESMSRIDMFKQYMRQCLGDEDLLGEPFHHINYNKWFSEIDYRKEICRDLKLKFNDEGMDYVPFRGGGSSFDKGKFQGRGSEMDVLNRWKVYENNERFCKLLDSELKEYSKRYFNFDPYETRKVEIPGSS